METTMQHPMFEGMEGHAELAIQQWHIPARKIPIRFHPQTLCFEAFFDPADEVVAVLASVLEPVTITLRNVVLRDTGRTVRLKADGLQLYRSNALHEWPESMGWHWSDFAPEEKGTRRLEISPQEQVLQFTADAEISTEHPYQVYYGNACPGVREPVRLQHSSLPAEVSFCRNFPQRGLLCAFSAGDFFALEERIHAAWMLIHGRGLALVLRIQGREVYFYGHQVPSKPSHLPLLDDAVSGLSDSVMHGFVDMVPERFNKAYLALKYFVSGKQADVVLEARYMLLMICVEAMDGEETRQLKQECTAAMLRVSTDAAFLFNGMRNQLVHGRGSYQQAFAAFLQDDLQGRQLQLEPALQRCVVNDVELDFMQLWLRLCERLDAFWCAYLNVPAELVAHRYAPISLMPAVDLQALDNALEPLRKSTRRGTEEPQVVRDLRQANQRKQSKIEELNARLNELGKAYAQLKQSCQ